MIWTKPLVHALGVRNTRTIQRAIYRSLRTISGPRTSRVMPGIDTTIFSEPLRQVFFGYYDISPFSYDGKYLLATQTALGNVSPAPHHELAVGYYSLDENKGSFAELGRTTTWCWQQGCRLQWYPSRSSEQVLYNRLVEGRYGCVIQNIRTREVVHEYSRPVYSVSHDGRWGVSLDFSRLQRLRPGYGYATLPDITAGQSVPHDNGIWRIDMRTGDAELLFSLKEIAALTPKPSMRTGEHYFNHLCFNPEGSRFMFFHLCKRNGKRANRLLTSDVTGQDIHVLENERTVSHYAWKSNSDLLATASHPDAGLRYIVYDDGSGKSHALGADILKQDGHPSYFPDHDYLLTDTYPDRCGDYHILIYDHKHAGISRLASFYSPLAFSGEVRCDLHPRLNNDGNMMCADMVHRSRRAMWVARMDGVFSSLT